MKYLFILFILLVSCSKENPVESSITLTKVSTQDSVKVDKIYFVNKNNEIVGSITVGFYNELNIEGNLILEGSLEVHGRVYAETFDKPHYPNQ